jgi:hypothetical protein
MVIPAWVGVLAKVCVEAPIARRKRDEFTVAHDV